MKMVRAWVCALCALVFFTAGPAASGAEATQLYITKQMNVYGLMDEEGNAVPGHSYPLLERLNDTQGGDMHCFVFYEYAPSTGDYLAGALDSQGNTVLEALYNHITLENGMLITEQGDPEVQPPVSAAFTMDGKCVLPPNQGWLSFNGYMITRALETTAVYYTADGEPAPAFGTYTSVRAPFNGLCAASQGGKWGFIDAQGDTVIPLVYDSVTDFKSGDYTSVILNGNSFLIDTAGTYVYGPTGMFMYFDGKCWIGNCSGHAILMDAQLNTLVDIIDEKAAVTAGADYYEVTDSKKGTRYVDAKGKPVIQGPYNSVKSMGAHLFCVTYKDKGEGAYVVNINGTELFAQPGMVSAYIEKGYIITVVERLGRTRYGMRSLRGNALLDPVYDRIAPLSEGVIEARIASESGYIRPDGTWLYCVNDLDTLMD